MTFPPALAALVIPAGLFAAWLFLHKDADVEQRIDKKEAIHEVESASFDKDFARATGDKQGFTTAMQRLEESQKRLDEAYKARIKRESTDQREAVRNGVDDFLKPKEEGEK
jgi:hypothetical protein